MNGQGCQCCAFQPKVAYLERRCCCVSCCRQVRHRSLLSLVWSLLFTPSPSLSSSSTTTIVSTCWCAKRLGLEMLAGCFFMLMLDLHRSWSALLSTFDLLLYLDLDAIVQMDLRLPSAAFCLFRRLMTLPGCHSFLFPDFHHLSDAVRSSVQELMRSSGCLISW